MVVVFSFSFVVSILLLSGSADYIVNQLLLEEATLRTKLNPELFATNARRNVTHPYVFPKTLLYVRVYTHGVLFKLLSVNILLSIYS